MVQGFELKSSGHRQVADHLSHALSPFCFRNFGNRTSCLAQAVLDCSPPSYASGIARMTVSTTELSFIYWLRCGLMNFLPRLALKCDSPDF
jgi:hypothetical protein